ncbi:endonuclease/exonuclease/phosphatase family protein [Streptomyces iconiensis]|uniref:Endonuclease/exonuclease/phosphatase family protein n=1 Tax=Streptomyces iconiensis TaxID=1384038 RepID=A0ABT6ZVM2_9ACTN|nr:endonuclease/exonuclease/phosphatase family protein [Streptomyces iconiensis]MDJ1133113.1 endonuclease/exonuclease/phosphatase family protein [Streptomyces iconiensis]
MPIRTPQRPGARTPRPTRTAGPTRPARTAALTVAAVCSTLLVLPATPAGAGTSASGGGTSASGGGTSASGGGTSASGTGTEARAAAGAVRIHDIQGATRLSPYAGERVTDVPGIVTGVRDFGAARGFWLQDARPDKGPGSEATSEGLFVFTGKESPGVAAGDDLRVTGKVSEFYPGGKEAGGQSVTQLTGATWKVAAPSAERGGKLPPAFRLTPRTVPSAYAPRAGGDSIENRRLRPGRYALDRYESLEGMRASVSDVRVTGPTSRYHDLWVTTDPRQNPTPRGGTLYGGYDEHNGARVKVSSLLDLDEHPFPVANVGDRLRGTTEGPLDYEQFGGYTLRATTLGEHQDRGLQRERTRPQRPDELSVATYNVENLSPKTEPAKFDRLAEGLTTNLSSPDIVTVEEVQDDTGPTDDGTVGAGKTLDMLTEAIRKKGGPSYKWRQIDPADKEDGGQPGGNIRVAFLYNPERVSFTDRPGGDATTPVEVTEKDGKPALSASPGRIAPQDPAWKASRKPLAGEFRFKGRQVFVVANHFSSKGGGDLEGDQPMEGRFQPPARHSEPQRVEQAKLLNSFVRDVRALDRDAVVVAGGDFNDFPFSPALEALRSGRALTSPMDRLPRNERYGYVFNGNSQTLDHLLTSPGAGRPEYDIVHINAEFADQSSDHDPSVVRVSAPWR